MLVALPAHVGALLEPLMFLPAVALVLCAIIASLRRRDGDHDGTLGGP